MAKFTLTATMATLLSGVVSGSVTHVAKSADVDALVKEGLIEVNPQMLDANGNAAARATDKGKAAAPASAQGAPVGNTAPAASKPLFAMSMAPVELPSIKRGGNTAPRTPKYPLADIALGHGLFIAAEEGQDAKKLSKRFGSMIADFNKEHTDRYLTTRYVEDGKEAGFVGRNEDGTPNPDMFAGKAGIGIYHRPLSERKERKPRAPKAETTTA